MNENDDFRGSKQAVDFAVRKVLKTLTNEGEFLRLSTAPQRLIWMDCVAGVGAFAEEPGDPHEIAWCWPVLSVEGPATQGKCIVQSRFPFGHGFHDDFIALVAILTTHGTGTHGSVMPEVANENSAGEVLDAVFARLRTLCAVALQSEPVDESVACFKAVEKLNQLMCTDVGTFLSGKARMALIPEMTGGVFGISITAAYNPGSVIPPDQRAGGRIRDLASGPPDVARFAWTYHLCYQYLSQWVFNGPKAFFDALNSSGSETVAAIIREHSADFAPYPGSDTPFHLAAVREDRLVCFAFAKPPSRPIRVGNGMEIYAPYFVALRFKSNHDSPPDYLILGQGGDGGTTLRAISPDGKNSNLGRGCKPTLEEFITLIAPDIGPRKSSESLTPTLDRSVLFHLVLNTGQGTQVRRDEIHPSIYGVYRSIVEKGTGVVPGTNIRVSVKQGPDAAYFDLGIAVPHGSPPYPLEAGFLALSPHGASVAYKELLKAPRKALLRPIVEPLPNPPATTPWIGVIRFLGFSSVPPEHQSAVIRTIEIGICAAILSLKGIWR